MRHSSVIATSNQQRSVTVERTATGRFTILNARDGHIVIGTGDDASFTSTELLLAAIGAAPLSTSTS